MNFNPLNQKGKPKEHKEEVHGWVICGFADNIDKAGKLFDEGEQEQLCPYFKYMLTHVIVLDARDNELKEIAAKTSDDFKKFKKPFASTEMITMVMKTYLISLMIVQFHLLFVMHLVTSMI